jgi:hypothetical protein
VERLAGLHPKGMLASIRIVQKLLTVTNTLAYYNSELITAVKRFMV